jgi:hypothetical protein
MTETFALRATVIVADGSCDVDALLADMVRQALHAGRRVRGARVDLETQEACRVSQPLGRDSSAWRADPQRFAQASQARGPRRAPIGWWATDLAGWKPPAAAFSPSCSTCWLRTWCCLRGSNLALGRLAALCQRHHLALRARIRSTLGWQTLYQTPAPTPVSQPFAIDPERSR